MKEFYRLQRNHYFNGRLLTDEDFNTEQTYFRERLRRHNRYLHGWGVVSGLDVTMQDNAMVVTPGMAIDCIGNELYLETRTAVPIPKNDGDIYLFADYCESAVHATPALFVVDGQDTGSEMAAHIEEGCRLLIETSNPISAHTGCGPGTPGCGQQHPVLIACLHHDGQGWCLLPGGRRGQVQSCLLTPTTAPCAS